MAKIPFDIKFKPQIESGEYKVETRNGLPVRIICWDRKHGYSIVGLAYEKATGCESYVSAYADGTTSADGKMEFSDDLFIVTPEPELTEWQRFISDCLQKHGLLDCGAADRIAKESAAELLDLARKQLAEEQYTSDPRKSLLYKLGKAEALKDLPRWKKAKEYMKLGLDDFCFTLDNDGKMSPYWDTEIEKGQYYITEADLEKLPKED